MLKRLCCLPKKAGVIKPLNQDACTGRQNGARRVYRRTGRRSPANASESQRLVKVGGVKASGRVVDEDFIRRDVAARSQSCLVVWSKETRQRPVFSDRVGLAAAENRGEIVAQSQCVRGGVGIENISEESRV